MTSRFTGFSDEDLQRIKSSAPDCNNENVIGHAEGNTKVKSVVKLGSKHKKLPMKQLKSPQLNESTDKLDENCLLSKLSSVSLNNNVTTVCSYKNINSVMENNDNMNNVEHINGSGDKHKPDEFRMHNNTEINHEPLPSITIENVQNIDNGLNNERKDLDASPDVIKNVDNNVIDITAIQTARLEELQIRQKLMEEQNKKRKEMLAKALADRTQQTKAEAVKLAKIREELSSLEGQLSQDVAMLRTKIDQACHSYADAEKQYYKIEKEFLSAKLHLQKEREKKELLIEHLAALITHNETRKAQRLELLMLQLADTEALVVDATTRRGQDSPVGEPVIVDGVDERTGKMVELPS